MSPNQYVRKTDGVVLVQFNLMTDEKIIDRLYQEAKKQKKLPTRLAVEIIQQYFDELDKTKS